MNHLEYYKKNYELIYNNIENPQWRIFKAIREDGACHQNKFQITSPKKLLKFILQNNPTKLYMSISQFLNPSNVHGFFANQKEVTRNGHYFYPRSGWIYANCILIGNSDFFIDIDDNNLDLVQKDARKIIRYMETRNDYKFKSITFSGNRGIHLIYTPFDYRKIEHPIKRIQYQKLMKEKLTDELLKLGLKCIDKTHRNIMNNIFCMRAIPYSIKGDKEHIVIPINKDDFMSESIYDILSLKPTMVKKKEMASDTMKMVIDKQGSNCKAEMPCNPKLSGARTESGLRTCPNYYMCVANFVPGLKNNYVPFIKIHKSKRIKLKNIINDLGDILIFEEKNHYWLIGYKLFLKEKLIKVMRKLKASNQMEFQRRYAKFRFSNVLDNNKNEIERPPRLIKKIKAEKQYAYSKAHYNFFKEFDAMERMYGDDKLKTYKVTLEA